MLKAIKIKLYPSQEQMVYINQLLGTSRFIYNQLLAYKIYEYNTNNYNVKFGELGKKIVELKSQFEWIKNSHSKVLQQTSINLMDAYKNFFRKNGSGFPKFKSKHDNKQSCRFPSDAFSGIKGNRVNIIKPLSNILFKCSVRDEKYLNKYQKSVRSATLTKNNSGEYYLSILIDSNEPIKVLDKPINDYIGIDLGIKDFIVTSNGDRFDNIKVKRNNEKQLSKLHKQLSKKVKDSHNREKTRIKLAKKYNKLNNIKENYLHSVVNQLLNENQVIVMEDLNVKGMMRNDKLSKSIQELSLYRFKEMLKYKSEWYGRDIIEIDRFYPSSKLCSDCGYKYKDLKLSEREWICPACGTIHNRDYNAAINIMNEGKRINEIKAKIGLSSPEYTLVDNPTVDDKLTINNSKALKSSDWLKQEKHVFH